MKIFDQNLINLRILSQPSRDGRIPAWPLPLESGELSHHGLRRRGNSNNYYNYGEEDRCQTPVTGRCCHTNTSPGPATTPATGKNLNGTKLNNFLWSELQNLG